MQMLWGQVREGKKERGEGEGEGEEGGEGGEGGGEATLSHVIR